MSDVRIHYRPARFDNIIPSIKNRHLFRFCKSNLRPMRYRLYPLGVKLILLPIFLIAYQATPTRPAFCFCFQPACLCLNIPKLRRRSLCTTLARIVDVVGIVRSVFSLELSAEFRKTLVGHFPFDAKFRIVWSQKLFFL